MKKLSALLIVLFLFMAVTAPFSASAQLSDADKTHLSTLNVRERAEWMRLNSEKFKANRDEVNGIFDPIRKAEKEKRAADDAAKEAKDKAEDEAFDKLPQAEKDKIIAQNRAEAEKKRQELAARVKAEKCAKKETTFRGLLLAYVGSGTSFCWFCPMFAGLFDAMNNLATSISVKMADVFLMIMGVGLLFSISFKVAKMLTSMQGGDLMQFLTDMFKHLGRAIIATALLVSSLSIFTYLVSPVLSMSMAMSSVIMDEGGGRATVLKASQGSGINTKGICDDLNADMQVSVDVSTQTKAFTPDVKASFICSLRTMSAGLIFGVILGVVIYTLAFTNLIWGILPNIQYAALGLILVIGHLAILISFPFKLIDSMIRMAFVTALMPLWIILWVFPATVGYTKKAWDLFLSSCLIFVCLSVVITLVMNMMQYSIPNREKIIELLACGFDPEAAKQIPIGGKSLLVTAALTFLGWKMLGTATTLASSFVGAIPDLGIGNAINETTIKGAKLAAKGGKTLGRAAGRTVGMDTGKFAKNASRGTAWTAATVATAGIAPLGYGAYRGIRAALGKFGGKGGAGGAGGGAPNVPPTPRTPMPTGGTGGGTPNIPPKTPMPSGGTGDVGGTPNIPPMPKTSMPSGAPNGMPTPPIPTMGGGAGGGAPSVPPTPKMPTMGGGTGGTSGMPASSFGASMGTTGSTTGNADTSSVTMGETAGTTTGSAAGTANVMPNAPKPNTGGATTTGDMGGTTTTGNVGTPSKPNVENVTTGGSGGTTATTSGSENISGKGGVWSGAGVALGSGASVDSVARRMAEEAKSIAQEASSAAKQAKSASDTATAKATLADSAAATAQAMATSATNAATTAASAATSAQVTASIAGSSAATATNKATSATNTATTAQSSAAQALSQASKKDDEKKKPE